MTPSITQTRIKLTLPVWTLAYELGYEPQTTFWQDFSIADKFGIPAIFDTFKRAFKEWKHNHVFLTELVMVLNHKISQHYVMNGTSAQNAVAKLYNDLYEVTATYAEEHLTGDELQYYYRVTD